MTKTLLAAAALATILIGVGTTAPAQARMADPALSQSSPSALTTVQYRRWHRRHRHCWRGRYGRMRCGW
jgi:hypothetical protein